MTARRPAVASAAWRPVVAGLACAMALLLGCRPRPEPIRVDHGRLVVENLTRQEWRDVTVTVNAYIGAGHRRLNQVDGSKHP